MTQLERAFYPPLETLVNNGSHQNFDTQYCGDNTLLQLTEELLTGRPVDRLTARIISASPEFQEKFRALVARFNGELIQTAKIGETLASPEIALDVRYRTTQILRSGLFGTKLLAATSDKVTVTPGKAGLHNLKHTDHDPADPINIWLNEAA